MGILNSWLDEMAWEGARVTMNDEERDAKVRAIIKRHFGVEIYRRQKELALIGANLHEAHQLLRQLKEVFDPNLAEISPKKSRKKGSKTPDPRRSTRQLTKSSSGLEYEIDPEVPQYGKRESGQCIQFICPVCLKAEFSSLEEFFAHCEMFHDVFFSSYEEAANRCGIPVHQHIVPMHELNRKMRLSRARASRTKRSLNGTGPHTPNPSISSRSSTRVLLALGNSSKHLDVEEGDTRDTHEWTIYVRLSGTVKHDLKYLVKRVTFIFPDFMGIDQVVLDRPPFEVKRRGWGEFPVRVVIVLGEADLPPVYALHQVFLDPGQGVLSGVEVLLSLDFSRGFLAPTTATPTVRRSGSKPESLRKSRSRSRQTVTRVKTSPLTAENMKIAERALFAAGNKFILVEDEARSEKVPYRLASSIQQWFQWSVAKRRAHEWMRATAVQQYLIRGVHIEIPVRRIMWWFRDMGFVPSEKMDERSGKYCTGCGGYHNVLERRTEKLVACQRFARSHLQMALDLSARRYMENYDRRDMVGAEGSQKGIVEGMIEQYKQITLSGARNYVTDNGELVDVVETIETKTLGAMRGGMIKRTFLSEVLRQFARDLLGQCINACCVHSPNLDLSDISQSRVIVPLHFGLAVGSSAVLDMFAPISREEPPKSGMVPVKMECGPVVVNVQDDEREDIE